MLKRTDKNVNCSIPSCTYFSKNICPRTGFSKSGFCYGVGEFGFHLCCPIPNGIVHTVHGHSSIFLHCPMCKDKGNREYEPKGLLSPLKLFWKCSHDLKRFWSIFFSFLSLSACLRNVALSWPNITDVEALKLHKRRGFDCPHLFSGQQEWGLICDLRQIPATYFHPIASPRHSWIIVVLTGTLLGDGVNFKDAQMKVILAHQNQNLHYWL